MAELSADLLASMLQELLGRRLPPDDIRDIALRLAPLVERARSLQESRLHHLDPAMVFPVGHPFFSQPPRQPTAWSDLPATPGSSGYITPANGPRRSTVHASAREEVVEARIQLTDDPVFYRSAVELVEAVKAGEISPIELTRAVLDRAERLQPVLNSYITLTPERALADARRVQDALAAGEDGGLLAGLPIGVKDCFLTAGVRTTSGSRQLADYVPKEDATAVERLRRAGAVMIGKTNTHEWCFGGTNNNEHYGPARNPWNRDCIAGGSSGGSAAAVAAGTCVVALGTDAAGSVRIPASACGVVGFKPTYGTVSRAGVLPLTWSFDTVGWLTRSIEDAALLHTVLTGFDPADLSSVTGWFPDGGQDGLTHRPAADTLSSLRALLQQARPVRIGYDPAWFADLVQDEVEQCCREALRVLAGLGCELREVDLPSPHQMMTVHRLVALAEASAIHGRYLREEPDGYSRDVRLRLQMGEFVLARDYLAGQRLRTEICRTVAAAMGGVDVLVAPTLPILPPPIGDDVVDIRGRSDSVSEALIRLSCPFNVTGQPALSVPCGFSGGLPVGLTIVGRPFDDIGVLYVGALYERARPWRDRRPF